jgi:ferredoxin
MTGTLDHSAGAAENGPEPEREPVTFGTVIMRRAGQVHRLKHHPGETLLETARRAGVPLNSNCERGECGTCIVTILSGAVKMLANDVLSEADIKDGLTLGCQSVPVTEVVDIELP